MNPATFLRVLGPEPWNVAYVSLPILQYIVSFNFLHLFLYVSCNQILKLEITY